MTEPTAGTLSLRTALAMVAFTLAFTALMAGTYRATHTAIAQSAAEEELRLIDEILPRAAYDNDLLADTLTLPATPELGLEDGGKVWRARRNGAPAGLVIQAAAPDGYSGHIGLIVAIGADNRIRGVRVIEHKETPGLGDYIDPKKDKRKDHPWIAQFDGKAIDAPAEQWNVRKDGGVFDYMTGATISPRAVTHAVGRVAAYVAAHRDTLYAPQPKGK